MRCKRRDEGTEGSKGPAKTNVVYLIAQQSTDGTRRWSNGKIT